MVGLPLLMVCAAAVGSLSHAGAGSGRLQCDAACCGSVATPKGFPWQPTNVALCALCPSAPTYQPILLLLLYALS